MLDLTDIPEEMKKLVNHYPIHIFEVHRFENTEWFQTDLREVFEFIQCAEDKEKLKEFVELRKDKLANMREDACDVIAAITKIKTIPFKQKGYRNENGGINMCKALEDWGRELEEIGLQRGQQQGVQQGLQQGLQLTSAALFQYGMSVEEFASQYNVAIEKVKSWYDKWLESAAPAQ